MKKRKLELHTLGSHMRQPHPTPEVPVIVAVAATK